MDIFADEDRKKLTVTAYLKNDYSNKWFKFILDNETKQLNWDYISRNTNLTTNHVKNNLNKKWNYKMFEYNQNTDLNSILKNKGVHSNNDPLKKESINNIYNDNLTLDFVKNNLNKTWDWHKLSYSLKVTMKDIINSNIVFWDWKAITYNPNIEIEDFLINDGIGNKLA